MRNDLTKQTFRTMRFFIRFLFLFLSLAVCLSLFPLSSFLSLSLSLLFSVSSFFRTYKIILFSNIKINNKKILSVFIISRFLCTYKTILPTRRFLLSFSCMKFCPTRAVYFHINNANKCFHFSKV